MSSDSEYREFSDWCRQAPARHAEINCVTEYRDTVEIQLRRVRRGLVYGVMCHCDRALLRDSWRDAVALMIREGRRKLQRGIQLGAAPSIGE